MPVGNKFGSMRKSNNEGGDVATRDGTVYQEPGIRFTVCFIRAQKVKPHFFLMASKHAPVVGSTASIRCDLAIVLIPSVVRDRTAGPIVPNKPQLPCREPIQSSQPH